MSGIYEKQWADFRTPLIYLIVFSIAGAIQSYIVWRHREKQYHQQCAPGFSVIQKEKNSR